VIDTTQHEWLRRLSDYHSGGVDDEEAAAVEEHLAGCEECREVLNVYRRFYLLASSPLHLGEPSNTLAEELRVNDGASHGFRVSSNNLEPYPYPRDRMRPERNRVLLGIASVLAASLVIVGFLAVLGTHLPGGGGVATPTPLASATHGPTPTVQTTHLVAPGTGYTESGPDWATMLAFAPSSPSTVYACGESPLSSGPLLIDVSTDGGQTWHPRASPGKLSGCIPTVDPTNPRDLALVGYYCSGPISPPATCDPHTHLYRSYDGGQSWSEVTTPGGDWIDVQIAWLGGALFIGTTEGIARSVSGGPMTLLRQSFFGTTSDAANARRLFTSGNALIVQDLTCPASEESIIVCNGPTARSDDLGAHWSLVPMTYHSSTVNLAASGGDGTTLLGWIPLNTGTSPSTMLLRSTDGGTTWKPLPPLPASVYGITGEFQTARELLAGFPIVEAPDGTVFTMFNFPGPTSGIGSPTHGIYELVPGASNWRYFAPPPRGDPQIFLWSSSGHLAGIWGGRGSLATSGFEYRLF
jgi:hypothetical protein